MLCDECLKNTASVHLTTFVNGQVKTVHIFAVSARQKEKNLLPLLVFRSTIL